MSTTTIDNASQVRLTGRMLNFSRLRIQGSDIDTILSQVAKKLDKQQQSRLPVVLSCEHELNLEKLWAGLWDLGLQPMGITTGVLDKQAQEMKVAIFPVDGQRVDGKPITATTNKQSQTKTDNVKSDFVYQQMLRSGQAINHVGGDVILTQGINAGAEAITDYNLYIYGKAEGRIVAGATGDVNAKIFCTKFNPTLVSVAGTYCIKEEIPPEFINQAVIVSVDEQQALVFTPMEV